MGNITSRRDGTKIKFMITIKIMSKRRGFEYVAPFSGLNLNHEICPFAVNGLSAGIFRSGGGQEDCAYRRPAQSSAGDARVSRRLFALPEMSQRHAGRDDAGVFE